MIVARSARLGNFFRTALTIVNGIWAVPAVVAMRALSRWCLVRVGTLNSGRIGHFTVDGAEQIARFGPAALPAKVIDWWWLSPTCNRQWELMVRRTLAVHWWVRYLISWNLRIPGGGRHSRPSSLTSSRDTEGLFVRHDVKLPFTPRESEAARAWLRKQGWTDGEPFVCLIVRDAAYMAEDPMQGSGGPAQKSDWEYHDYRNSDVETYLPAIEWLVSHGVWVFRMGKLMAKPLPGGLERVVDYAFDPERSDLLDVWLFANCQGCISTATGPDGIALIYQRPILYVNALPLGHLGSFANSVWVPKHMNWRDSGKQLSLRECLEHTYLRSEEYDAAAIEISDLDPGEIKAAVEEFWLRCTGCWNEAPVDQKRQDDFWEQFTAWPEYGKFHSWRHPHARVGAAWLKSLGDEYIGSASPAQVQ